MANVFYVELEISKKGIECKTCNDSFSIIGTEQSKSIKCETSNCRNWSEANFFLYKCKSEMNHIILHSTLILYNMQNVQMIEKNAKDVLMVIIMEIKLLNV